MPMPSKPCKWCGSLNHWPYQCFYNPKPRKKIKLHGQHYSMWEHTRNKWFKDNWAESYECYLCGRYLLPTETTLDHIKPRSSNPELRYEMSNLAPCCMTCNTLKGSQSLENYKKGKDYA